MIIHIPSPLFSVRDHQSQTSHATLYGDWAYTYVTGSVRVRHSATYPFSFIASQSIQGLESLRQLPEPKEVPAIRENVIN